MILHQFRRLISLCVDTDTEPVIFQKVLETLLRVLERYSATTIWSGLSCDLAFGESGQAKATLALLHLLVDRWLPAIE